LAPLRPYGIFSIVSIWEIGIKSALGKLAFPRNPGEYARRQIERQRFRILGIDCAPVDALTSLPHLHRDPFDRMIIAQAITERASVVTADEAFAQYEVDTIVI
jgi:PIN domain nuclease of toxin-antitoxin system